MLGLLLVTLANQSTAPAAGRRSGAASLAQLRRTLGVRAGQGGAPADAMAVLFGLGASSSIDPGVDHLRSW